MPATDSPEPLHARTVYTQVRLDDSNYSASRLYFDPAEYPGSGGVSNRISSHGNDGTS